MDIIDGERQPNKPRIKQPDYGHPADLRGHRMPFQLDQPMKFCMNAANRLSAVGMIDAGTPRLMKKYIFEGRKLGWHPSAITFHSPGGELVAAIEMGFLIRELKLHTHVGGGSECSSACYLAFIGGWSRKVTLDGQIGFHQISSPENNFSLEEVQTLISSIASYHERMQVSPLALSRSMLASPDQVYWYTPLERAEWGIVTKR